MGQTLEDVVAAVVAAKAVDAQSLGDPALRGPRAGDNASIVAKIPEVRTALLDYQRNFARRAGGAILDGRDIGTVVCPDADIKIFVTASDEVRARRRHLEHQSRGEDIAYERVLEDLRRRDARDSGRSVAPLHEADDARHLDTTSLDPDQAFAARARNCRGVDQEIAWALFTRFALILADVVLRDLAGVTESLDAFGAQHMTVFAHARLEGRGADLELAAVGDVVRAAAPVSLLHSRQAHYSPKAQA